MLIARRLAAAVAIVALAVAASAPSAGAARSAECPQWKVRNPFVAVQDNGYWVTFQLQQRGTLIWGKAGYALDGKSWRFGETSTRVVIGNAGGRIVGNRFFVRVYWTYSGISSVGVYRGEINPAGLIRGGRTYDELARPAHVVYWYGRQSFMCF